MRQHVLPFYCAVDIANDNFIMIKNLHDTRDKGMELFYFFLVTFQKMLNDFLVKIK